MGISSSTRSPSRDTVALISVGVLAGTFAAICHETLGHGLGCLEDGGHITLLTSVWFRCAGASATTEAGGPIGNLVAGVAALSLVSFTPPNSRARLFVLMSGALNLYWFTAQLAHDSLTNTNDWHFAALQMGWSPIWRGVAALIGIGGYLLVMRMVSAIIRKPGSLQGYSIRLAYAGAAASAVIAGLMWQPEPFRSAFEGGLVLGVAPLGLLGGAREAGVTGGLDVSASTDWRSWLWICVCAVLFGVFLFVQARGLGSMASSRLLP